MKVLYCRIGWMNAYRGNGDERPQGGGKYNEENIGHEVHNYLGYNEKYFGFVEAGVKKTIHVEKLCGDKKAAYAENILVVWVARKPSGGQYVIGWYEDATVYRVLQNVPKDVMSIRTLKSHNIYNIFSNRVYLLEPSERTFQIEGMGHSNIWYGNEETDKRIIEYVAGQGKKYEDRIGNIEKNLSSIVGEEKEAIVKIRINQDKYRTGLLTRYKGRCCVCGADEKTVLMASHIKPWTKSDEYEKLDLGNGLLLCPNHDKLFDRGLISFAYDGSIMIAKELDEHNRVLLNVHTGMNIKLEDDSKEYMRYHRENIFQDS